MWQQEFTWFFALFHQESWAAFCQVDTRLHDIRKHPHRDRCRAYVSARS
jgi:hypothetical protein